jgi:hypothetical protein
MTRSLVLLACLSGAIALKGCGGGPQPADWQLNSAQAMAQFQRHYLAGEPRADAEFALARRELAATGREDLVARAELLRCALRVASLDFDDCPGFLALKEGARPEQLAYAEYLMGKGGAARGDEPLSRLVGAGVRLRKGEITPGEIAQAVELASAEGWRRPLLAWLGVQEKRAREAGDADAAARIRRRIDLISG